MNKTTTLYFVRHGETEWNVLGRFQGHADIELNETGHKQAQALAHRLNDITFDAIYASPLKRAISTALPTSQALNLPIITDERIKEVFCGEWEGLVKPQMKERDPELFAAWRKSRFNVRMPGGECMRDVQQRMVDFYESIYHSGKLLLVVSHGGALLSLISYLMDWDYDKARRENYLVNTGVTIIKHHHVSHKNELIKFNSMD